MEGAVSKRRDKGKRFEVKVELGDGVADEAVSMEVSMEELSEFLEADLVEVDANPEFKERLRRRLWEIVSSRHRH